MLEVTIDDYCLRIKDSPISDEETVRILLILASFIKIYGKEKGFDRLRSAMNKEYKFEPLD